MEGAFLLLDEEHRSSNWRFQWMDSSVGQILSEECVKLFLFCRGEGERPPPGEFGIGMKLYGMVPCLTRGEMGKGFFREDICEVFIALWNGTLGWTDSLSLGLFCKSLQGGQRGADAFLPFQSEKDHVNCILLSERRRGGRLSWWGIGFGQNTPIAAGGASRHQDLLGDPVHFQVMEGEPGVSYDHRLLSEVCDSEMCSFGMASEAKSDMDFLQLLINHIMVHYTCILWTLLAHKIALNRSFPTILLALNLAQWLWSYSQNTD